MKGCDVLNNKKGIGSIVAWLLVAVAIFFGMFYMLKSAAGESQEEDYAKIMRYFDTLQVSEFEFDLNSGELNYKLKEDSKEHQYKVPNVSLFVQEVLGADAESYRQKYDAENPDKPLVCNLIKVKDNSMIVSILPTIIMIGLMIAFFVYMTKNISGSKMGGFAKANAKNQANSKDKKTFDDVAGADEEKQELAEIVDFLKDNKKYKDIGARVPKGVLLLGPPGTGKTLLAKAVAGEAGVPFFSISGSDFVEMYVGVGASRVRDLFETAKKNAPSIIFIDEIDAVGRQRGTGLGGGHDEREQTLNQLLVEMDGFSANDSVIVIAATNRRDILDPALLRPGRFDRQVLVSYPDVKGREEILKVHMKGKNVAPDVNLETVAKSTVGFTGADLANLTNEAALLAARANRKAITQKDIDEASIKVVAGPEKKSRVVSEKEKKLTAYHEGGHAVCTYYCEKADKVHQVSIIPRGQAGGFTMSLPEKDKSFVSRGEMLDNIIVLLGGRVAEEIILDDISTGASNDLERATATARKMVTQYGFSKNLGAVVYGQAEHEVFLGRDYGNQPSYSEEIASKIDAEIRMLVDNAYEQSSKILTEHIDKLHAVAKALMEKEKINGDEFEAIMNPESVKKDVVDIADKNIEGSENIESLEKSED